MAQGLTQVKANIRLVDRKIDGIRRELMRRVGKFNTLSANAWQLAWDRCPDLREMETTLFAERGNLQQARDHLINDAYLREARSNRRAAKKASGTICAACGQSLAA